MKKVEYQEREGLLEKESRYWGERLLSYGTDLRKRERRIDPINIWDDPEIEDIMRGKYRNLIIEKASVVPHGRVLELGCGVGWLSLEIARRGMNVEGIDISERCIKQANDYHKRRAPISGFGSVKFNVGDLNRIKLKKSYYDAIVVWDALHHVAEIDHLIKQVRKALKPDAVFLVFDCIAKENFIAKVLHQFFYLILPVNCSYIFKIKSSLWPIIKHIRSSDKKGVMKSKKSMQSETTSPFEGVTGCEMVKIISRWLKIETLKNLIGFCGPLVARIRGQQSLHLVKLLKIVDYLLVNIGILRGAYLFIIARKIL